MDYEQNNNLAEKSSQPLQPGPKKRSGWRIFWGIFTCMSVLGNVAMFLVLLVVIVFFAAGQHSIFTEEIIQEGPRTNKIAIISLQGVINNEQSVDVYRQLKIARKDSKIKGLIIRVNSPGGTISASDQIYNEIRKFREQTNKPVVAFMQAVAASGGYYTSVACDKIVAEPTAITGSIGVILGYMVLQELLEGKLGILPVIVKSGEKKDWPSSFRPPTEEQLQYLQDKLIKPAYQRFVQIVADGRESLSIADVKRLADGSIYTASEALDEKLIDKIGYLDDAVELVLSLANIKNAQVVQYRKPFSFSRYLSSQGKSFLKIDKATLYEFSTPEVMYLWNGY